MPYKVIITFEDNSSPIEHTFTRLMSVVGLLRREFKELKAGDAVKITKVPKEPK